MRSSQLLLGFFMGGTHALVPAEVVGACTAPGCMRSQQWLRLAYIGDKGLLPVRLRRVVLPATQRKGAQHLHKELRVRVDQHLSKGCNKRRLVSRHHVAGAQQPDCVEGRRTPRSQALGEHPGQWNRKPRCPESDVTECSEGEVRRVRKLVQATPGVLNQPAIRGHEGRRDLVRVHEPLVVPQLRNKQGQGAIIGQGQGAKTLERVRRVLMVLGLDESSTLVDRPLGPGPWCGPSYCSAPRFDELLLIGCAQRVIPPPPSLSVTLGLAVVWPHDEGNKGNNCHNPNRSHDRVHQLQSSHSILNRTRRHRSPHGW